MGVDCTEASVELQRRWHESDDGTRRHFHKVRADVSKLLGSNLDEQSRAFLADLLTEIELATVGFARERVAEIDLPAQKLVVLRKN